MRHPDQQRAEQRCVPTVSVERDDGRNHYEEAGADGGPVGKLDGSVLAPDHQCTKEDQRTEVRAFTREREETRNRARHDKGRTGVEREPQVLGHVFFLGTDFGEGERRQGRGLKKLLAKVPGSAAAEQQRNQTTRGCGQTNRHLLHRELPLAMHLRLHRYGRRGCPLR